MRVRQRRAQRSEEEQEVERVRARVRARQRRAQMSEEARRLRGSEHVVEPVTVVSERARRPPLHSSPVLYVAPFLCRVAPVTVSVRLLALMAATMTLSPVIMSVHSLSPVCTKAAVRYASLGSRVCRCAAMVARQYCHHLHQCHLCCMGCFSAAQRCPLSSWRRCLLHSCVCSTIARSPLTSAATSERTTARWVWLHSPSTRRTSMAAVHLSSVCTGRCIVVCLRVLRQECSSILRMSTTHHHRALGKSG